MAPPAREGESGLATCNDSLGMLSTVAALYGEMSGGEGKEGEKQSNTALSVGDGMAQMRLESSSGTHIICVPAVVTELRLRSSYICTYIDP